MPIRGLEEVRKHPGQNFFLKVPQKAFKKMRICIDGNWFLKKYVDVSSICEGLMGGMDRVVREPLSKLLEFKRENEVDLIWVWDGMCFGRPQGASNEGLLGEGLKEYKKQNYRKAGKLWRSLVMQKSEMDVVNKMLEENGVVVVSAPYSATAQCAYFMSAEACSYVFGKSDVLLFEGVDRIILDMSDGSGKPHLDVFHKSRFLEFFGLTPKTFCVLGLLLGCDFCPTVPKCAIDFSFSAVFKMAKGSEDLLKMIKGTCDEGTGKKYTEQFLRGLMLVMYHPVMKTSGSVQPYSEEHVPRNLEKIFGAKLAPGFYENLFMNRVSCDVLQIMGRIKGIDKESRMTKLVESVLARMKDEAKKDGKGLRDGAGLQGLFMNIVCPGMVLPKGADPSVGVVLLTSIQLGELEAPFCQKILCLHGQAAGKEHLEICDETLKYYESVSRMFNYVKEMKEVYETTVGRDLPGLFSQPPMLFSSCFHEAFGFSGEAGESNRGFLRNVLELLVANRRLYPAIPGIIEEIEAIVKK